MIRISDNISKVVANIDKQNWGIKSGIKKLDEITLGFQPAELTILAGYPGMGKTALAIDFALNMSKKNSVVFFSLEMPTKLMIERMISNQMEVSLLYDLRSGKIDKNKIIQTQERLSKHNIYIDDNSSLTPEMFMEKMELITKETKVDCVIIDYLQLMRLGKFSEGRRLEIDDICRSVRSVGKHYGIPIILLSQLRRPNDGGVGREPRLSDLKESGGIEETADCVLLLHRPVYYQMKDVDVDIEDDGEAYIIVGKQRNGMVGRVPCVFMSNYMAWRNCNWTSEEF